MNSIITRKCSRCGEIKSIDQFSKPHTKLCSACFSEIISFYHKPPSIEPKVKEMLESRRKYKAKYVYLISSSAGLTKIGVAENVSKRLFALQTASPTTLELVYSFFRDRAIEVESYLHAKFTDKRIRGEWFDLSQEDINWIKGNYE